MKPLHFLFGLIGLLWIHCLLLIVSPMYLETKNEEPHHSQSTKIQPYQNISFKGNSIGKHELSDLNFGTNGHATILK